MTLVVTMSANTAAYAAEAIKPSARISGDRLTEEAITLLSGEKPREALTIQPAVPAGGDASALSLMLMSAHRHLPQNTRHEAIRMYLENADDEEESPTSVQEDEATD